MAVSEHIDTAVADVRGDDSLLKNSQHGHGCAHTVIFAVHLGHLVNDSVGKTDAAENVVSLARQGLIRDPKNIFLDCLRLTPAIEAFVDELHRHSAGDLSGKVATHPIGYYIEPQCIISGKRVLVSFSFEANIGYA